jgi:hypothetical protein
VGRGIRNLLLGRLLWKRGRHLRPLSFWRSSAQTALPRVLRALLRPMRACAVRASSSALAMEPPAGSGLILELILELTKETEACKSRPFLLWPRSPMSLAELAALW